MRPVIDLKARVAQVRNVNKGDTIGYSAGWTVRRPARIAIVSVGYGDGYLRASGSSDETPGGFGLVGGKRCPIAGRVSMDLLALDITDAPAVKRGEFVTLIGGELDLDAVATAAGTIAYELLTALGHRYHRVYRTE
jgi:alanine racemase